jgi:hypothetical protein
MNEVFICFEFHDNGIGNNSGEWKIVKVCKDEEKAIDFVNEGIKTVESVDPINEIDSWFDPSKSIEIKKEYIVHYRKYIKCEVE